MYSKKLPPANGQYPTQPNIEPSELAALYTSCQPGPNFLHKHVTIDSSLNLQAWDRYRPLIDELDDTLVDNLKFGFCMGVDANKEISIPYTNHKSAIEQYEVIDEFVIKHYEAKAIAGPYKVNPLPTVVHPSPLQVATSASGKRRAVIDMSYPAGRSINDAIPEQWSQIPGFSGQFHLPTHEQICERILDLEDPLMGLTDLKAYYMQLPSDPNDYPYMAFAWRGCIWIHLRLPFGCRSACLHAQRVTEAVCHVYRQVSSNHVAGYVDDYCDVNERAVARSAHLTLHWLMDDFGLDRTPDKCLIPDELRVFLGLLYDLRRRLLKLPEEKLRRAVDLLEECLTRDTITRAQLESLVGFLNHLAVVVVAGKPFNALMYDSLVKDEFPMVVDDQIRQDLVVWSAFLQNSFTNACSMKRYISAAPDVVIALAVKQNNCVILCNGRRYGYRLETNWIIPKSLMPAVAVWLVTCNHMEAIAGQVICVSVPTKVSQNVINRVNTSCRRIRPMLRDMWIRQAQNDCYIKARYGIDNVSWLYSEYVVFNSVKFMF